MGLPGCRFNKCTREARESSLRYEARSHGILIWYSMVYYGMFSSIVWYINMRILVYHFLAVVWLVRGLGPFGGLCFQNPQVRSFTDLREAQKSAKNFQQLSLSLSLVS